MPDTLAEPWTWASLPVFHRTILESLCERFRLVGLSTYLVDPVSEPWYKVVISNRDRKHVVLICTDTHIEFTAFEAVNHFNAHHTVDLGDPGSIDKVYSIIISFMRIRV